MSVRTQNERAYTLCSDKDTILPDNYQNCVKLSVTVKTVHGSHSTIENVGDYISELLTEIEDDRLLLCRLPM